MKIVLLTRYPRVDTPAWKRALAESVLLRGDEVAVLYTRSRLIDQVRAGLGEFGAGAVGRYLEARRVGRGHGGGAGEGEGTQTLAGWARERGIEVSLHVRLDDRDCLSRLRALEPDLLVLLGADIVPAEVLEIPRIGTLNGHYGLLPRYRGMNVTEWSIYHDDPVGVSVHMVDPGIDTGAIVAREPIPIAHGDGLERIRERHREACARLLATACAELADGGAHPIPQLPAEGRQYYRMHPALRAAVESKLEQGTYRWVGAPREELDAELEQLAGAA